MASAAGHFLTDRIPMHKTMSKLALHGSALAGLMLIALAGCGASPEKSAAPQAEKPTDEIAVAMAELPPADRAKAEKQVNCPVSKHPLGSMGMPFKVVVEGQEVFLCCEGCVSPIKDEPQKYLATMKDGFVPPEDAKPAQ